MGWANFRRVTHYVDPHKQALTTSGDFFLVFKRSMYLFDPRFPQNQFLCEGTNVTGLI